MQVQCEPRTSYCSSTIGNKDYIALLPSSHSVTCRLSIATTFLCCCVCSVRAVMWYVHVLEQCPIKVSLVLNVTALCTHEHIITGVNFIRLLCPLNVQLTLNCLYSLVIAT